MLGPQDVLADDSAVIGTLHVLVHAHSCAAADSQHSTVTWIALHVDEDAYARIGVHVAGGEGPVERPEPDAAAHWNEVDWGDARSPAAGNGGDAGHHRPPDDIEGDWIVNLHRHLSQRSLVACDRLRRDHLEPPVTGGCTRRNLGRLQPALDAYRTQVEEVDPLVNEDATSCPGLGTCTARE